MRHGVVSRMVALVAGVIVSIAGVAAVPGAAWARSLGSYAGNPLDNTPRTCFAEHQGGLSWTGGAGCPNTGRWQVELPVDSSGSYTVTVRMSRDNDTSQRPTCQVLTQTQDGVLSAASTAQQLPASPTGQFLTLTMTASVPTAGYMFVYCSGFGLGDVMAGINY